MSPARTAARLVTGGLLALGLSTAALAQPVSFDTAAGEVTLEARPDSIVALDVAAIDTITALGVIPDGIVSPLYVDYLPAALSGAATVGSLFEADFEGIAALAPDLIVVGGRAQAQAGALARIAPVADMTVGTDALAEGRARLLAYGTILGRDAQAQEMAEALDAKVARVRDMVEAQGGDALILMTNGPKLSVFGPDSRFGWLHSALGFGLAVDHIQAGPHGEAVSFEYVAEADPDTLIVIDRGAAVGQGNAAAVATLDTPLIQDTRAAKAGRIIYLSPAEIYIAAGGIQSLNRTLDEIGTAFGGL